MVEISSVLATSVSDFIDYALWITAAMIVYYFIRFAMGTEKKKEEESSDDPYAKLKTWFKSEKDSEDNKKVEKEKEKKLAERRKHLNGVRGFLLRAIEDGSDLITALNRPNPATAVKEAHGPLIDMRSNVSDATRELRRIFRQEKDAAKHDFYDSLYRSSGMALKVAERIEIPPVDATNWDLLVKEEKEETKDIRKICAAILERINKFIKDEDATILEEDARPRTAVSPERPAHPPSGGRGPPRSPYGRP